MADIAHHEVEFDAEGQLVDPGAEAAVREAVEDGQTSLLVFAHGWNNSHAVARRLFGRFFARIEHYVPDSMRDRVATIGVIWPSMRWPDEPSPEKATGGAASLAIDAESSTAEVVAQLKTAFGSPPEQEALDRLGELLDERPRDRDALLEFQELLGQLASGPNAVEAEEDQVDEPLLAEDPEEVFMAFADLSPDADAGGAAGLGDVWKKAWRGAREAMRVATYYQMKKRAGIVGQKGLGPLIGRLPTDPDPRVTTIGHSFGARLVSFSLAGLPDAATGPASPVKGMFLVQGAFSHYSFAKKHPFRNGSGALAGMWARVDGPIVVTHTERDLALAEFYPKASLIRGQDAAALNNLLQRWGAMGWHGAQEVDAAIVKIGPVGTSYVFRDGQFLNLDCNALIKDGPWPFGSHSDIIHDELGWIIACAAVLTRA